MSSLLIRGSAINRFARVAAMEDNGVNERRRAGPPLTQGLSELEMKIFVVRYTVWPKEKRRCG